MKNQIKGFLIGLFSFLFFSTPALAHVIVYPRQVGIAATQVFDMSVPTEKDNPTVAVKLLIPDGLLEVVPSVKSGWDVSVKKNGDKVTEIDWVNGSIPPEERDDFYFSAQVPAKETTLKWKAYQTYKDGSIVAWDNMPTSNPMDDNAPPPYSTTMVINDLTPSSAPVMAANGSSKLPLTLSIVALSLSALSFVVAFRKKK